MGRGGAQVNYKGTLFFQISAIIAYICFLNNAKMELPHDFLFSMQKLLSADGLARLMDGLAAEPAVSVRLNPSKTVPFDLHEGATESVPWCREGRYLNARPSFTFDPLLHVGAYYVQEASSMFLAHVLREHLPARPLVALDLCAAPGGKSTLMRSLLPEGSLLVSNEPMRLRAQILQENMTKWGHPATVVTQNYPEAFGALPGLFDLVVADVPCSGEGMFRKDEGAVAEWSAANVAMCAERQRGILSDVWPALKPGGLLVYSTCTFNTAENEENVAWIARTLGADVLTTEVPAEWGIRGSLLPAVEDEAPLAVHRFMPGYTRGEGLFMAVLRKQGEPSEGVQALYARKEVRRGASKSEWTALPTACCEWVNEPGAYAFFADEKGVFCAFPSAYSCLLVPLRRRLNVLQAGVPVAECRGHDWQPVHALALSTTLNRAAFPLCPLTYEQAVAYLRREAVVLGADVPRGIVCLTFGGLPLGFVKQVGGRANNLYPNEWRIRSGHVSLFCLCPELL